MRRVQTWPLPAPAWSRENISDAAELRLAPPAAHVELDRVERLGTRRHTPGMRARHDPAPALEAVDLDRARARVHDPEMPDPLASVHLHLAAAVESTRGGRDDLAGPVRGQRQRRRVGDGREPLASPAREVGNEDVLPKVQLRLVQDPPAARSRSALGRATEGPMSAKPIIEDARAWGNAGRGLVKSSPSMISATRWSGTLQRSS